MKRNKTELSNSKLEAEIKEINTRRMKKITNRGISIKLSSYSYVKGRYVEDLLGARVYYNAAQNN